MYQNKYKTREQTKKSTFEYIENFYYSQRKAFTPWEFKKRKKTTIRLFFFYTILTININHL
ncbi:hypothetical protein [Flavobacterium sp. LC2016-12]|uniref:hypothetical protein n=1 Tax=Flavobacterium sp. LC2016-12 TaxID=2783794 RepID=UPI00188BAA23|nr:hypothetical protein [Flavobacterium sp. LC2016-12]